MTELDRGQLRGLRKRKMELLDEIEHIKNELKEVDNELESMYYVDESGKSRMKVVANGRKRFNKDPANGIQYLLDRGLLSDERTIAQWLFETEGLSKGAIGDYLGLHDELPIRALEEFVKCFDFQNLFLVDAIRLFLKSFRLPGEAQKIDRIMDSFSRKYVTSNPQTFESADACHSIAFSSIMLNTLLYNPNVKDRITLEGYIDMCKEYLTKKMVTIPMLTAIYDSLRSAEFAMPQDETGSAEIHLNADREGWLYKQSSGQFMAGPLAWKKRWFVLSEQCLYYFENSTDREPRGIIPLQNVGIRRVDTGSRPHMFEIFSLSDDRIKACKTEQDGRMVEGTHSVYRICAANQEDLRAWIEAIAGAVTHYPIRPRIHSLHDTRWLNPIRPLFSPDDDAATDADEDEEFDPFKGCAEAAVQTCGSCQFVLDPDRSQIVAHYQSPWHKYNIKRSVRGLSPVTEEDFDENDLDSVAIDNIEQNEEEDDAEVLISSSSRAYFLQDDNVFSCYRVLINQGDVLPHRSLFMNPLDCAIFLMAGGHFAAGIFKDDKMIKHKTFQRYVIRAKQGGAQSANDNANGHANSAGANLRRYNERTLQQDIMQLLKSWAPDLLEIPYIFIRVASFNKKVFHGEGLIDKADQRIRSIPFATKRPSLDEVKETWRKLVSVFEHGPKNEFLAEMQRLKENNKKRTGLQKKKKEPTFHDVLEDEGKKKRDKSPTQPKKTNHLKVVEPVEKEEDRWPELSGDFRHELYSSVKENAAGEFEKLVENSGISKEAILSYLNERTFNSDELTFLHVAVFFNAENSLRSLLDYGCDPMKKNAEGKVPYASGNKTMKKIFVDFRKTTNLKWDWKRTLIPEPVELTEEQVAEQEAKKKAKKQKQKEKLKEKKEVEKKEAEEKAARDAFLALSEREKRALAAEARLAKLTVTARCVNCGENLPKVPFRYLDVNLCSPACVSAHRAKNTNA
ncbi:unnamed protein product [Auanema sp. JU1783]|nr:unnamed protein product [Auanema sp. JU1783]